MSHNFSNINQEQQKQKQNQNQQPLNININIKDLEKSSLLLDSQIEDITQSPFNAFSSTISNFYLFCLILQ